MIVCNFVRIRHIDTVAVLTGFDYRPAQKCWEIPEGRMSAEGNEMVADRYRSNQ
jgi:hypothetical protein